MEKISFRLFEHDGLAASVRHLLQRDAGRAYLVGGSVRDVLLGRETHDLDFVVDGDALEIARNVADRLGAPFYPLDARRRAGRIVVRRGDAPRVFVDVTALQGGSIEADLAARDFTINAMAVDLGDLRLIDPFGGREDLARGRLTVVSDRSIANDPVRGLRAVRQALELGFTIDRRTEEIVVRDAEKLGAISRERVRDELVKMLSLPASWGAIRELDRLGLMGQVIPELAALHGVGQSLPHRLDVWDHSLLALQRMEWLLGVLLSEAAEGGGASREALETFQPILREHLEQCLADDRPRWLILKLATLLHDIGKPGTRTVEESGRVRFIGHERSGSDMGEEVARRLRFSSAEVRLIETIIRHHMRPLLLAQAGGASPRAAHRFYRDTGAAGVDVILVALADAFGQTTGVVDNKEWDVLLETAVTLLEYRLEPGGAASRRPILSGKDIMTVLGIPPGPQVGRYLELLKEAQVSGEIGSRDEALKWLKDLRG